MNEQRDHDLARAEQLKQEAGEVLKRWMTEPVSADNLVGMGRKLAEAMRIYYAYGLVGEVVGDRLRAVELDEGEFAGAEQGAGTFRIPDDGKWRVVSDRVFEGAYCIGAVEQVDQRADGGHRIVYRPRGI